MFECPWKGEGKVEGERKERKKRKKRKKERKKRKKEKKEEKRKKRKRKKKEEGKDYVRVAVASSGQVAEPPDPQRNVVYRIFYPKCNLFFRIASSREKVLNRFYRFKSITTLTVGDFQENTPEQKMVNKCDK